MPLKKTLVKRKENRKVDTAIQRALTYGVPIINHGRSRTFIENLSLIRPVVK